jgi:hypothetical protein
MTLAKRPKPLEQETLCPTCGRLLKQAYPDGLPFDITTLTKVEKQALYEQLSLEIPSTICGLPVEEFSKLPWEERKRMVTRSAEAVTGSSSPGKD